MASSSNNNRVDSSDETSESDDSDSESRRRYYKEFFMTCTQAELQKVSEKMTALAPDQYKKQIGLIEALIALRQIREDRETRAVQNVPIRDVDAERSIQSKGKGSRMKIPVLSWIVWEREHQNFVDEHLRGEVDLESPVETAETPSDLVKPLMQHQKEGLAWAIKQEEGPTRGGILADEMGMGKTIQAIALVLAKREFRPNTHVANSLSLASTSSTGLPSIKATLVVCPVVAVTHWVDEIDKFTVKGSSKVLVHHGPKREKSSKNFSNFDFVITTYGIVASEYKTSMMAATEICDECGGSYEPGNVWVHRLNQCGQDANKTENQPSEKILHSVKWNRIILDEAQYIKDRKSNTTKAIFALESSYKWALSGTPLQNHVGELYSPVRFLQVVPYSYYLCRDCDCWFLEYRHGECSICNHDSSRHFCWWNKYITRPMLNHKDPERQERAMILLKHKVLKEIALRRTKANLIIPHKIETVRLDALDAKEKDFYETLYIESQAQFNTFVAAGTVMSNYAHIFQLLTRLRQAVDHPYLVTHSKTAAASRIENMLLRPQDELVCGICEEPAEDPVVLPCAHTFCKDCLLEYSLALGLGQLSCKTCSLIVDLSSNSTVEEQTLKTTLKGYQSSSILNRIDLNDFPTSTKIEALREEIRFMVERDGSAKGIVFSQFTTFLDLISYSLEKSGVSCVPLDGRMNSAARDASIKKFTDDPDCKILLMSLKAGGVALNLTVASHVFLMDPWWNPAAEQQAQDRIHRIGQHKVTRVVTFVIENTIEERVSELRKRKKLALDLTDEASSEFVITLSLDELRHLFV